jgi:hypothetical protein
MATESGHHYTGKERRAHPHLPLRVTALLTRRSGDRQAVRTITENLSVGGFYCRSREQFSLGEELDCTIEIPGEPPNAGTPLLVRCQAQVLRVENGAHGGEPFGIACSIQNYHVLQHAPAAN